MLYPEATAYLFSQLPMFERQGAAGYKEGLDNTLALDEWLGHPHTQYRTIHIAGTNGKGSCSHTIAAILQAEGLRVGLYTSPHLVDFRERIRVNGQPISEEYVANFVELFIQAQSNSSLITHHLSLNSPPTFFELTTAMAFKYFADKGVDVAVVEVGLGGRLDCTNIITPTLSIITNISLDHTQLLGNTLQKIAAEKAGIIKPHVPALIGEATGDTRPVFERKAKETGAAIVFAEDEPEVISAEPAADGGMVYRTAHFGMIKGQLGGACQTRNTNTILSAARLMAEEGLIAPDRLEGDIKWAMANVAKATGLMGRWQLLGESPRTVCDTGHNPGAWTYLAPQLNAASCQQLRIVFGMVGDKDVDTVLAMLPKQAQYYFTQADNHRAVPCQEMKTRAEAHGLKGNAYPTVAQAYNAAKRDASADDFIFIGGSSYVVGEVLAVISDE